MYKNANAQKSGGNTNPLENINYTDKVNAQMKQGDYHSFPGSVDAFGADGTITTISGDDGIVRTRVEIQCSYGGREGTFEYIIEPDEYTAVAEPRWLKMARITHQMA